MKYLIFDQILASDIPLPELPVVSSEQANLSFTISEKRFLPTIAINCLHEWRLPDGRISFSIGRDEDGGYWLNFPHTVDFQVDLHNNISGYRYDNIPDEIIRHLLLDQVIPRLLQHCGKQILHASCVQYDSNTAIAFSGESGRGKSTLGVYWHNKGYSLLTDDCLMMKKIEERITFVPNYQGVRLLKESVPLHLTESNAVSEVSCGAKNRVIFDKKDVSDLVSLKAIIILADPESAQMDGDISIRHLVGSEAAIALVKNSFPLDITDKMRMGRHLCSLTEIAGASEIDIYKLYYPRRIEYLPSVFNLICDTCLEVEG